MVILIILGTRKRKILMKNVGWIIVTDAFRGKWATAHVNIAL